VLTTYPEQVEKNAALARFPGSADGDCAMRVGSGALLEKAMLLCIGARQPSAGGGLTVFDGNSRTFRVGADAGHTYPERNITPLAGGPWAPVNTGTLSQIARQTPMDAARRVDRARYDWRLHSDASVDVVAGFAANAKEALR